MQQTGSVDPQIISDIVQRIVSVAKPHRVIMFGSAADGRMGPSSDVDLLVISDHDEDRSRILGDIYIAMYGVGQPVDIIMVTPDEVERYCDSPGLIIRSALEHGKDVYRAGTPTTG